MITVDTIELAIDVVTLQHVAHHTRTGLLLEVTTLLQEDLIIIQDHGALQEATGTTPLTDTKHRYLESLVQPTSLIYRHSKDLEVPNLSCSLSEIFCINCELFLSFKPKY